MERTLTQMLIILIQAKKIICANGVFLRSIDVRWAFSAVNGWQLPRSGRFDVDAIAIDAKAQERPVNSDFAGVSINSARFFCGIRVV
ncbi:MAG: hypothetical protein WBG17_07470 [Burkholderiaceae bacterium]